MTSLVDLSYSAKELIIKNYKFNNNIQTDLEIISKVKNPLSGYDIHPHDQRMLGADFSGPGKPFAIETFYETDKNGNKQKRKLVFKTKKEYVDFYLPKLKEAHRQHSEKYGYVTPDIDPRFNPQYEKMIADRGYMPGYGSAFDDLLADARKKAPKEHLINPNRKWNDPVLDTEGNVKSNNLRNYYVNLDHEQRRKSLAAFNKKTKFNEQNKRNLNLLQEPITLTRNIHYENQGDSRFHQQRAMSAKIQQAQALVDKNNKELEKINLKMYSWVKDAKDAKPNSERELYCFEKYKKLHESTYPYRRKLKRLQDYVDSLPDAESYHFDSSYRFANASPQTTKQLAALFDYEVNALRMFSGQLINEESLCNVSNSIQSTENKKLLNPFAGLEKENSRNPEVGFDQLHPRDAQSGKFINKPKKDS